MKEYLSNDIEVVEDIREKIYKYSPIFMCVYGIIYLLWFSSLEKFVKSRFIIHSWLDSYIPFVEWFVIPYIIWFGYVAFVMIYFAIKSRRDFVRTGFFLCVGMTICLIIYTIAPNGINLRPTVFPRDNFLTDLVKFIYSVDTATNVCPSIHCLNSIGIHIGIVKSEKLGNNKKVKLVSFILMVAICMSTVFIKQHSIIDFFAAITLSIPLYYATYVVKWNKVLNKLVVKRENI